MTHPSSLTEKKGTSHPVLVGVFPPDSPYPGGSTFIQWKGTNVCMDWIFPVCEERYHVDADFCYFLKCLECGSLFEVGTAVSLTLQDPTSDQTGGVVACSPEDYV